MSGWFDDAACLGLDPELFFPEHGGRGEEALAVCADCPVQRQCVTFAAGFGDEFGIFGGTHPRQRRPLLRVRSEKAAAYRLRDEAMTLLRERGWPSVDVAREYNTNADAVNAAVGRVRRRRRADAERRRNTERAA